MAPSPPLIPRRVSKSYENIKLKGQESIDPPTTVHTVTSMGSHPPIPPRKGYENVELKESKKKMEEEKERGRGKEGVMMATSPGVNPPVPLKRARSPQPPKELCPITPPVPARRSGREKKAAAGAAKNSKKTKLFKVTSMPYCPVSPDDSSPQLPARGKNRSVSNPVSLPLEVENDDSANCDKPSPYYSLPPDSLSPMAEIDARFQINDSDEGEEEEEVSKDGEEEGLETYLTLGEEIQSKARSGSGTEEKAIKSPVQYCPPLPPKVHTYMKLHVANCLDSSLLGQPSQFIIGENSCTGSLHHYTVYAYRFQHLCMSTFVYVAECVQRHNTGP